MDIILLVCSKNVDMVAIYLENIYSNKKVTCEIMTGILYRYILNYTATFCKCINSNICILNHGTLKV